MGPCRGLLETPYQRGAEEPSASSKRTGTHQNCCINLLRVHSSRSCVHHQPPGLDSCHIFLTITSAWFIIWDGYHRARQTPILLAGSLPGPSLQLREGRHAQLTGTFQDEGLSFSAVRARPCS